MPSQILLTSQISMVNASSAKVLHNCFLMVLYKVIHEVTKNGKPIIVKVGSGPVTTFYKSIELCQKEANRLNVLRDKDASRLKREKEAKEKKKTEYLDRYK